MSTSKRTLILSTTAVIFQLWLGGCASPSRPTLPTQRTPLKILPGNDFAVLVGEELSGLLSPRVYVLTVDGIPVPDSENSATAPIRLSLGAHEVEIAQRAGGFFARVGFRFIAEAQTAYRARAQQEQDVPWYNQQLYSAGGPTYFWIENDSTGRIVTDKQKVMVNLASREPYIPPVKIKK